MYKYEVFKIHSLSSRSYGILAKEKIGRSWITVAVTAPFSLLQRVKHTRQTCFIRSQDSATMGQHTDSERSLLRGLPGKPRAVMESMGNYHLPEA